MKAGINTLYTLLHYVLWHCKRIGKQVRQSLPKHLSETSTGATRCKYKINVCENFCRGCDFTKIQSSASKRNRFLVNDGRLFSSFNFGLMFSLVQAHSEDACWGTANDHHSCLPRNVRQPVEKKKRENFSTVDCAALARQPWVYVWPIACVFSLPSPIWQFLDRALGYRLGFIIFQSGAPSYQDSTKSSFLIDFPSLYCYRGQSTGFHKVTTIDLSRECGPSLHWVLWDVLVDIVKWWEKFQF